MTLSLNEVESGSNNLDTLLELLNRPGPHLAHEILALNSVQTTESPNARPDVVLKFKSRAEADHAKAEIDRRGLATRMDPRHLGDLVRLAEVRARRDANKAVAMPADVEPVPQFELLPQASAGDDPAEAFRAAIRQALSHDPGPLKGDGKKHRFSTNSRKQSDDAGWYKFYHDEFPAGSFGDYRGTEVHRWKFANGHTTLNREERRRMEAIQAKRRKDEAAAVKAATASAEADWEAAQPVDPTFAYLAKKGIGPHGARYGKNGSWEAALLVPVRDIDGNLLSLQSIFPNSSKRFTPDTLVKGGFYQLGDITDTVTIAEGFATAATIHEMFPDMPVIVAFNSGNLLAVAKAFRKKYPDVKIVIAADDDLATFQKMVADGRAGASNAGQVKGLEAAKAVGAIMATPPFDRAMHADPSDWNDFSALHGRDAAKAAFASAMEAVPLEPEPDNIINLEVARLARLDQLHYEIEREGVAKTLGLRRISKLDEAVAAARPKPARQAVQIICNRFGIPLSSYTNCMTWLASEAGRLKLNLMSSLHEIDGHPITEDDVLELYEIVEKQTSVVIIKKHVIDAMERLCGKRTYHPVLDQIRPIEWDTNSRVDGFLTNYFHTEDTDYSAAVSRAILIGGMHRMTNPGEVFRYVPVLIGPQNIGKSLGLDRLFSPWIYSTNTGLSSDKLSHEIQGMWALELGDLHAFDRSDLEAAKNFISRLKDHFRVPYARYFLDVPRCLIILGTANHEEFLKDDSGETRWLPIKCGLKKQPIDLAAIAGDRDQLWAEAFARRNKSTLLEGDALTQAERHQREAKERDSWQPKIEAWLDDPKRTDCWITTENILIECLGVKDYTKHSRQEQNRIGRIMRSLGYRRGGGGYHTWTMKPNDE